MTAPLLATQREEGFVPLPRWASLSATLLWRGADGCPSWITTNIVLLKRTEGVGFVCNLSSFIYWLFSGHDRLPFINKYIARICAQQASVWSWWSLPLPTWEGEGLWRHCNVARPFSGTTCRCGFGRRRPQLDGLRRLLTSPDAPRDPVPKAKRSFRRQRH